MEYHSPTCAAEADKGGVEISGVREGQEEQKSCATASPLLERASLHWWAPIRAGAVWKMLWGWPGKLHNQALEAME